MKGVIVLVVLALLCCAYPGLCKSHTDDIFSKIGVDDFLAGHERMRKLAKHYEVVDVDTAEHLQYVGRQRRSSGGSATYAHPDFTSFEVRAFGKIFKLNLELNKVLLPAGFHVRSYTAGGGVVIDRAVVNCYYQGTVQVRGLRGGDADASNHGNHAVVNTCGGISGTFGVGPAGHWTDGEAYFIEPLTSAPNENGTHLHGVYKGGDAKSFGPPQWESCGVGKNVSNDTLGREESLSRAAHHYSAGRTHNIHQRLRRDAQTDTKYVELLMIMDHQLYKKFKGDVAGLGERARVVANLVDWVYRPLHVRIALVAVEVFSARDRFPVISQLSTTFRFFKGYYEQQRLMGGGVAHDTAQLLTSFEFSGAKGIASYLEMCHPLNSIGISADTGSTRSAAAVLAHELGHLLGIDHDVRAKNCKCARPNSRGSCLMAYRGGPLDPGAWSNCSRRDLVSFLGKKNGWCLSNAPAPAQLYGGPVCGNGFVEGSEECDCGTVAECSNGCCNATTCRLTAGSQCSAGRCCDDCKYRSAGTVCRAAAASCDVPEICTGRADKCPDNLFMQNGQPCVNVNGPSASYCYNGSCDTRTAQCVRSYGEGAISAEYCYLYNSAPDSAANCGGTKLSGYKPCARANRLCGSLWCSYGEELTILPSTRGLNIYEVGLKPPCKVLVSPTSSFPQVTHVADGVVCGNDSICISNACRKISSLGITPCPSQGGQECAGNGVCTNLNTCLCNPGWRGRNCLITDSAAVAATGLSPGGTAALVICLLLLLAIVSLLVLVWKGKVQVGILEEQRLRSSLARLKLVLKGFVPLGQAESAARPPANVRATPAHPPSPTPLLRPKSPESLNGQKQEAGDSLTVAGAAARTPSSPTRPHPPPSGGNRHLYSSKPTGQKTEAPPARPPPPSGSSGTGLLHTSPAGSKTTTPPARPPPPSTGNLYP